MIRFLIVNTDYPGFLDALYRSQPGLEYESFARQLARRNASRFGSSDYYPRNLHALGHDAFEVHINNRPLQEAWAAEHGFKVGRGSARRLVLRGGMIPWLVREQAAWMRRILGAQIEDFRPDVILTHSLSDLPAAFWIGMRRHYRLLVGQIASPLADDIDLSPFDLMLSSLPNFVDRFRRAGLRSALLRLAFDPAVLDELGETGPTIDVSFVGSLSPHHAGRLAWLERVCRDLPVDVWGQGVEQCAEASPLRAAWKGSAWGIEMFRVLRRSRISLNFHIEISGEFANNMRLYETTGVGSLLLTDWKQNLGDLFAPGSEVAVFRNAEQTVEQIRYYLDHEDERAQMARAGQQRTLRAHTYRQRMGELVELVQPLL